MSVFRFLKEELKSRLFFVALLSLVAGICNTYILKLINDVITTGLSDGLFDFIATIIVFGISTKIVSTMIIKVANKRIYEIREFIFNRIIKTDLKTFESLGDEKVLSSLTEDTKTIANSIEVIVGFFTNIFTVLACFVYLGILSAAALGVILIAIFIGTLVYLYQIRKAETELDAARESYDDMFKFVTDLLNGFKELKLNNKKRESFYKNDLLRACKENYNHQVNGGTLLVTALVTSEMIIFVALGAFTFSASTLLGFSSELLLSFSLVMLYLIGPITVVVNTIPVLVNLSISLKRIDRLITLTETQTVETETTDTDVTYLKNWESISFNNVSYYYGADKSFGVEGINFKVSRGDTIFITGGNGSGKTTLIKLLLGLYLPVSGRILVNGSYNIERFPDAYRNLYSTVFTDFHLFETLYGIDTHKIEEEKDDLLNKLMLAHKVGIENKQFTTRSLSQGQRKRLALVTAYLENKSIIVMDEFAADQDPEFRKYFYNVILPDLKSLGKTVIAITHDDKYFESCDVAYKMDMGILTELQTEEISEILS